MDLRVIIEVSDDSTKEGARTQQGPFRASPPSQSHRPTTRQRVHGRNFDYLFDAKYHPMDDVVRPVNAKRHREKLGLPLASASCNESDETGSCEVDSSSEPDRPARKRAKLTSCTSSRRSQRLSSHTKPDYSTARHPQDRELRQILGRQLKFSKPSDRYRKSKRKFKPPVPSDNEDQVHAINAEDDEENKQSQHTSHQASSGMSASIDADNDTANDADLESGNEEDETEDESGDDSAEDVIDSALDDTIRRIAEDFRVPMATDTSDVTPDRTSPTANDEIELDLARESNSYVLDGCSLDSERNVSKEQRSSHNAQVAPEHNVFHSSISTTMMLPRKPLGSSQPQFFDGTKASQLPKFLDSLDYFVGQTRHRTRIAPTRKHEANPPWKKNPVGGRTLSQRAAIGKENQELGSRPRASQSSLNAPVRKAHHHLQDAISQDRPPTQHDYNRRSSQVAPFPTPTSLAFFSGQALLPRAKSSRPKKIASNNTAPLGTSQRLSQTTKPHASPRRPTSRSSLTGSKPDRSARTSPGEEDAENHTQLSSDRDVGLPSEDLTSTAEGFTRNMAELGPSCY